MRREIRRCAGCGGHVIVDPRDPNAVEVCVDARGRTWSLECAYEVLSRLLRHESAITPRGCHACPAGDGDALEDGPEDANGRRWHAACAAAALATVAGRAAA